MTDWKKFWQNYRLVKIKNQNDLFYQVGKTDSGKVISEKIFNTIIFEIVENLNLNKSDKLLDLCCGNGVITYELSKRVNCVMGLDFSEPFIKNAIQFNNSNNIKYNIYDVKKINELRIQKKFTKVLLYDGLAYFNKKEAKELLDTLSLITTPHARILFGSVLDRGRKWHFFNTFKRKLNYLINIKLLNNNKGLGTWWSKNDFTAMLNKKTFNCQFLDEDDDIHTSHYRMDVLFIKNA